MRFRSSAYFFRIFAWIAVTTLSISSCKDWQPKAGPVRPQLLIEGATRVEVPLDESERYFLVTRFDADEEGNELRRYNIVDWKSRTRCELPENISRIENSLLGPSDDRRAKPLFLLPVVLQEPSEGEDPGPLVLTFYDENCQPYGETDYGIVNATASQALDEDGREVMFYTNGRGVLAKADPWHDERTEITTGTRAFSFVFRSGPFSTPQLLWIMENGQLTQRTFDGTLVLSIGEQVIGFAQVLLAQLRVAYLEGGNSMDGSDVYEAVGPDFVPTQIAQEACDLAYRGNFLEMHRPCKDKQLVRINLMTGETTEFDPGVTDAYTDTGYSFETKRDAKGGTHQWVQFPDQQKIEIVPPFLDRPFVLDSTHLVGLRSLLSEAPDSTPETPKEPRPTLAVWTVKQTDEGLVGDEEDIFKYEEGSVDRYFVVPDYRTSSYWWLVYHNRITSDDMHSLGTLSLVSARDRATIVDVASAVPLISPIDRAPSVRGYSIETLPTFVKERAIAYIDSAVPLARDARVSSGTLHVRLFSGELGSVIADNVTSYRLINAPLPGVLYGVEEGDQAGLWFAAL